MENCYGICSSCFPSLSHTKYKYPTSTRKEPLQYRGQGRLTQPLKAETDGSAFCRDPLVPTWRRESRPQATAVKSPLQSPGRQEESPGCGHISGERRHL